jgi:hypothetical protein
MREAQFRFQRATITVADVAFHAVCFRKVYGKMAKFGQPVKPSMNCGITVRSD